LVIGVGRVCSATSALLVIAVMISIITPFTALAVSPFRSASEVSMYILAVGEEGGRYFGVPTRLDVIVTNGSGVVYLSTEPLTQLDMQASARLAALIASYVTGKNFYRYDYFISVKSNSTIVGGPSAGAAMTVAIAAALLHRGINESVVETGMIMPDGTIGPVGGIPEKLQAAAEVHAKVMLIPAGQRIAYSLSRGKYVDVVQEGRKLGIRVVEVSTIYEALNWFGIRVPQPRPSNITLSGKPLTVVKEWIKDLEGNYSVFNRSAQSLVLKLTQGSGIVSTYLRSARELYSRAMKDLSEGKYYSTASDLFGALINASTAYWLGEIISGNRSYGDLIRSVRNEVREALKVYRGVRSEVLKSVDLEKLSIAVEVASRAMEANESLSRLPPQPSSPEDIYEASYVYCRARSVFDWALMYHSIRPSGILVSESSLRKDTALLVYFARTTASYIESLIGQSSSVNELLNLAFKAEGLESSDLIASLAIALRASATSATLLNSAFTTDLKGTAERLRLAALKAVTVSRSLGLNPVVAASYIERGDTLASYDYGSSIYFYDLSLINTMWYVIIAGGEGRNEGLTTTVAVGQHPSSTPTSTTPTPLHTSTVTHTSSTVTSPIPESPPPTTRSKTTTGLGTSSIPTGRGLGTNVWVDLAIILGSITAGFLLGMAMRFRPSRRG